MKNYAYIKEPSQNTALNLFVCITISVKSQQIMQTVIRSSFDPPLAPPFYYSHYPLTTGYRNTIYWAFSQLDKVIRHNRCCTHYRHKIFHVLLTISNLSFHQRPLHSAGRFLLPVRKRNGGCNALSALSLRVRGCNSVPTEWYKKPCTTAQKYHSFDNSQSVQQPIQQFQHDF